MATKVQNRSMLNRDQGYESDTRSYLDPDYPTRYGIQYAKKHYRTIGFKLNVESEKAVIAYLDYQPTLKPYLKDLILKDMAEHPEDAAKALEIYEEIQEANKNNINVRTGDVIMKCPNCGEMTVIRRNSYFNKKLKRECPACKTEMEAINPPDESLNPNNKKED